MPAVFTNEGSFTYRKLTDTRTLPKRPWFIALSPLSGHDWQKFLMQWSTHQNRHRLCVRKRVISNRLILESEGRTGMQQTAAENALFAPQNMWLFLGGVTHKNVCTGQVFPIEHNTFASTTNSNSSLIPRPYANICMAPGSRLHACSGSLQQWSSNIVGHYLGPSSIQ